MQNGCPYPPTKPKGRPKKDSIPTYGMEFTNSILCPIFETHGYNRTNGKHSPHLQVTTFTHNISSSSYSSSSSPLQ